MSLTVDITKRLRGFTLRVSFCSGEGTLGILGASGSGKSMTLQCIAGLVTPDEGRIEVNGRVLFDSKEKINLKPQKRRVGYLFQSYALFPHMTVEQNVLCALSGSREEKRAAARELLARYQLEGFENRYPGQLSGGQQQRAALARILAYRPEVLLLDEPFSALDAHLKEALQLEMLALLDGWPGDAVVVSHNRDELYKLSRQLMVLDGGRALGFGPTRGLFDHPRSLAVARLTGCKNFSRAKPAGPGRVEALDWGCTLAVEGPVPDALTHVGVRAHYFKPCGRDAENAIPAAFSQRIESPFEWNALFTNADAPGGGTIWWKYAKEGAPEEMPRCLCVSPRDVLLLEENEPAVGPKENADGNKTQPL